MIIECDNCATRFRLDDTRVTGGGVKVRCTKCENVFIVTPTREAPEAPGEPSAKAPVEPHAAEEPGVSVKIPQEAPDEAPQEDQDDTEEYSIPKLSFGELDTLTPDTGEPGGPGENIEEILDAVYKDEFADADPDASKEAGEKNGWPDPMEVTFDEEELRDAEEPAPGEASREPRREPAREPAREPGRKGGLLRGLERHPSPPAKRSPLMRTRPRAHPGRARRSRTYR